MKQHKLWLTILAGLMILAGLTMLAFSFRHTVTILVDEREITHTSFAIRPIDALNKAGIELSPADLVIPARGRFFFTSPTIQVKRAQSYQVITPEKATSIISTDRIPANILKQAGYALYPNDSLMINAKEINPYQKLSETSATTLQFNQAQAVTLYINETTHTIYSSQPTLGMALAEAEIAIHPKDNISPDLDTPLTTSLTVKIQPARLITASADSEQISGYSSEPNVGTALQDLGVSLQGLDFSIPDEGSLVPDDGMIQIVTVREALVLITDESPFTSTYEPDPNTEIDQYSVVQPGQVGMVVTRSRIRYADGKEIEREDDSAWKASDPMPGVLGYGTQIVTRTEVVDGQTIEYWRKISVYATSYAPCKQGYDYCTTATASGTPLEKGIVAVLPAWYRAMKYQQVYIPGYGYGIIADTGGGIPGRPWIDLGFSEADYESWHSWTSMYFITPIPAYIPYLLP